MAKTITAHELTEVTGIKDFSNLSAADAAKLLEFIGNKTLNKAQIEALVKLAPGFVKLAVQVLNAQIEIAKSARASQSEAIATIRAAMESISEPLRILAERAESDEARREIANCILKAGELYLEMAKITQQINANNNEFWWKLGIAALSVLATVLSAYAASRSPGSGNSKA